MTATIEPTIVKERLPSASARLSLAPAGSVPGLLDGAWWPRSRDLLREIPTLTNALDACWGRITHVTVNPAHWPVIPRKLPGTGHTVHSGHTVHVGWFADEQDPNKVILLSSTVGRLDLLVIPPETEPAAAARLMAAATVPGGIRTASGLMADEAIGHDAAEARSREEEWGTDGGASRFGGRSRDRES
ncbi:DUF5994 family protein [Streptomyces sp. DT2A-34]|uniref:DUF5994 family protein n=1 Tax=Streptomyces sp. DT2A-34 TaxID=3051182 RepID=UPI00265BB3FE|nr:DUF5994 family protein [Streptomyces sp. DT2A-34]MDO0914872.1 DUF5994 family protein [Streptomyces sp. DT2A-34]